MIEEIGDVLSRAELLASYRRADQYVGNRASQSELQGLRLCGDIALDKLEKLQSVEQELIGGTLEEEVNHFEARLIAGALERHKDTVTPAARELGLTHQDYRRSSTAGRAKHSQELDDQKEIAANSLCAGHSESVFRGSTLESHPTVVEPSDRKRLFEIVAQ